MEVLGVHDVAREEGANLQHLRHGEAGKVEGEVHGVGKPTLKIISSLFVNQGCCQHVFRKVKC